jgi:hypothetical protein
MVGQLELEGCSARSSPLEGRAHRLTREREPSCWDVLELDAVDPRCLALGWVVRGTFEDRHLRFAYAAW